VEEDEARERARAGAGLGPRGRARAGIMRARAALALVGAALRGRGGDPTRGPVAAAVVILAVPMVLEMVMESIFAIVDIAFVSRLGAQATAAVGLTESLMTLVYTIAWGLSIGVTSMVARRTGEGDEEGAAVAAVQAIFLGLVCSAALGVAGGLAAPRLLRLMGADAGVIGVGWRYATIMLAGNGVIVFLFLLNAAFRGAGDATIAMRVLWLANGINLVLDPCLIFGLGPFPRLGVTGAAVATTTGRGVAVLVQLATLLVASGRLRVRPRHIRLRGDVMRRMLRLSGTGAVQAFIGEASWIALLRLLAGFGSTAVAGFTIAIRVVVFALLPAAGVGNAAATMVGQALGARDPGRAERSVWIAASLTLCYLALAGAVLVAATPAVVRLFGGDPATNAYATAALRTIALGFPIYAYAMVIGNSFNGAGDTRTPTVINLVAFWVWEIPLAWALSHHTRLGAEGINVAVTSAFCLLALFGAVIFRRGRWKRVVV